MKRPYRFSMRAYPPGYRRDHGEELIDTALAMTGGRWSARQSMGFLLHGTMKSLMTPRRWWGLAVVFPVAFACAQTAVLFAALPPEAAPVWITKWLTIPSLPILFILMAERIAERPQRWRATTVIWAAAGISMVGVVARRAESASEAISSVAYYRLWPTRVTGPIEVHLDNIGAPWNGWTPAEIVAREMVTVVILATITSLVLRRCATTEPMLAGIAAPAAVMTVLIIYRISTPWAFILDYDFFVGDTLIGATIGELLFFPAPFDPVAGIGIGIAALSMGGLILSWGGAIEPAEQREAQMAQAR